MDSTLDLLAVLVHTNFPFAPLLFKHANWHHPRILLTNLWYNSLLSGLVNRSANISCALMYSISTLLVPNLSLIYSSCTFMYFVHAVPSSVVTNKIIDLLSRYTKWTFVWWSHHPSVFPSPWWTPPQVLPLARSQLMQQAQTQSNAS